ncbi:LysR substrate-binding domain-containing protein [Thiomonas sp.]|uniref:LysR family transcriptional regulator n=1 Tax=Thiomonas sp. TaxID=2047785 RepID=UPI00345DD2DB
MKNVTLRQLRVFVAAARHMHFGKAAQELHLTPPAVSMHIRELEQQVGLPLFERHGKSVSLTLTAEYLLVYARRVLSTLKDAEDALARFRGLQSGRLTIGMVSSAKYFMPRLLAMFREEHPHIELRVVVANREQLAEQLQGSELDLAIMGRPPRELATRGEPFAAHPLGVVCAPDHPLMRGERKPASALAQFGFVIREAGSGTRSAMEEYLREWRVDPRIDQELASNETIKQMVMSGMGVSFLSLHGIGLELRNGLIGVPDIEGLPLVRSWQVVHTSSKVLSPSAEALRYFVLENGEAYLAREFGGLHPMPAEPVSASSAQAAAAERLRRAARQTPPAPPARPAKPAAPSRRAGSAGRG